MREKCLRSAADTAEEVFTICIVPGDIGSEMHAIESVLKNLVSNYDAVCYLPGNHEAWRKGSAIDLNPITKSPVKSVFGGLMNSSSGTTSSTATAGGSKMAVDSVAKLIEVLDCAIRCGAYVGPLRVQLSGRGTSSVGGVGGSVGGDSVNTGAQADTLDVVALSIGSTTPPPSAQAVLVVPLYGWYHASWDTEPSITDAQFLAVERALPFDKKWSDFAACTWPKELVSPEEFVNITTSGDRVGVHNNSNSKSGSLLTRGEGSTKLAEVFAKLNEPFLHPPPHRNEGVSANSAGVGVGVASGTTTASLLLPSTETKTTDSLESTGSGSGDGDGAEMLKKAALQHEQLEQQRRYLGTPLLTPAEAAAGSTTVISFSHYLPRQELCPEKRFLTEPMLSRVIGRCIWSLKFV